MEIARGVCLFLALFRGGQERSDADGSVGDTAGNPYLLEDERGHDQIRNSTEDPQVIEDFSWTRTDLDNRSDVDIA